MSKMILLEDEVYERLKEVHGAEFATRVIMEDFYLNAQRETVEHNDGEGEARLLAIFMPKHPLASNVINNPLQT